MYRIGRFEPRPFNFRSEIPLFLLLGRYGFSSMYSWVSLYHYPVILSGAQPELY